MQLTKATGFTGHATRVAKDHSREVIQPDQFKVKIDEQRLLRRVPGFIKSGIYRENLAVDIIAVDHFVTAVPSFLKGDPERDSLGDALRIGNFPAANLLADINELESAIRAVGLAARFDRLSAADRATIDSLIDVHGTAALAAHAKALHRPMDPARFANAWIDAWEALPAPGFQAAAEQTKPACDCDNGWLDADAPCPACRPNLAARIGGDL
ncbi:hypothetical protein [Rhodococcus marinonascens]|uniref:hypothetical protein n=1 Tax=Rhodococcus marinonascens TaxID=38311 RepID=UPI000933174E|nr:hypothetical protein [Rhodococcus marinonascens]